MTETPMRAYLAAPLFSQSERVFNRSFAEELARRLPGLEVVLPQDFKVDHTYNDRRHLGTIYANCLEEIENADLVLAILDGADPDSGTAFEMGYATALGKTLIGIRTDYRPGQEKGVNLMCAFCCRFYVHEYGFSEDVGALADSVVRRLKRLAKERRESEEGDAPSSS